MNDLGNSLLQCFERLGELNDLNDAVLMGQDAVSLTPDGNPEKPLRLNNIGNSLSHRFHHVGELDDLKKCMLMRGEAVRLTPNDNPDNHGDVGDLNKSVMMAEEVVSLTPDGHLDKPTLLNNLGRCLKTRFEHLGPASIRLDVAIISADYAKIGGHPSLLDTYRVALDLLPEVAWPGLSISNRRYYLLRASKVIREAAAAAIATGQAETAVEWLEQGCSVIWGQLLNRVHLLTGSRKAILSSQTSSSHFLHSWMGLPLGQIAYDREKLLKQIRALEGFSHFLLPKTISQLNRATQKGPVVIRNITDTRCDALLLMPDLDDEVIHIPLDDFKLKDARNLVQSMGNLVGRNERLEGTREGQLDVNPEDEFARNLAKLWLGLSPYPQWTCNYGPLAFLPIHAAGLYGPTDGFGTKISDFVISSYAPSLAVLIEGFRSPAKSSRSPKLYGTYSVQKLLVYNF
ncbi:hypothetical protein C8R44DRAFT_748710 [Mycena epipterygia]|nr:hypothetical protein C8R44DRAFT_748710 [Mycena epipterygia]